MCADAPSALPADGYLFVLEANRLSILLRRMPVSLFLGPGIIHGREAVYEAFVSACHYLGTDKVVGSLNLPFTIIGECDEGAAKAVFAEPFPLPSLSYVMESADAWMSGSRCDALDALWNYKGLDVYGFSSRESRVRACAFLSDEPLRPYFSRSLKASLLSDYHNLSEGSGSPEPVQAIIIEPQEISLIITDWPAECFGVILTDEEYSWWSSEFSTVSGIRDAIGRNKLWPDVSGTISPLPAEEEISLVREWFRIAAMRPRPRKPVHQGDPDDIIDW